MKKLVAVVLVLAMMCGAALADEINLRDVAMQLKTIVEQYYEENYSKIEISDSAKEIIITGTKKVVVSDFAFVEGLYSDEIVVVLTNITKKNIPYLNTQVILYDETGSIIATVEDWHYAISPGSTVIMKKSIYDGSVADYTSVEVVLEDDYSTYYDDYVNHAEKIDVTENVSGDKIFLQVTNKYSKMIDVIEIVVVYYKNGVIVGSDIDAISRLKAGGRKVMEFTGYEDCEADSYKVFINQAHTW